jgi:hypothetical protein
MKAATQVAPESPVNRRMKPITKPEGRNGLDESQWGVIPRCAALGRALEFGRANYSAVAAGRVWSSPNDSRPDQAIDPKG